MDSLQAESSVAERVEGRTFPSVFQAWNPIDDAAGYPLDTLQQRLETGARHDLIWEEPISQVSFNTPLVLGVVWDGLHGGESLRFTAQSLQQALQNRARLLKLNPSMVMLMEIRWRDAPGSHLPEDSEWWLRNADGSRAEGWKGGPEPYYMLNYEHPGFQDQVARQARVAVESGVYDGVMLDWSGHDEVVRKVRESLGEQPIIIVNIHDDIEDAERYGEFINGSFMECDPLHTRPNRELCTWGSMARALEYFEANLRAPQINALEAWGERKDLRGMRAVTALGMTHSDAYVLFADPNPLPTPDHLHDWYDFWDIDMGRAAGPKRQRLPNGVYLRRFENGLVAYNPQGNGDRSVKFKSMHRRASDGSLARQFRIAEGDGDFFLPGNEG